jgi:MoaA/NifB/PqqE/SkfB family radical SAM enzyme
MRGIPGGFARDMETIRQLKTLGVTNIRLGFTITEKNISHLKLVYNLSKELGVEFTHSFAQSSEFYFGGKQNTDFQGLGDESLAEGMALGTEDGENVSPALRQSLKEQYQYIIKSELKSWNLKKWARAYFAFGMYQFITSQNPVLSNAPGRDFFFLDPGGVIYPSVVHNFRMGDIKQLSIINDQLSNMTFEQFWCSSETEEIRKKVASDKTPVWMICTARTAITKHPFSVLAWVIKNKFFGFKLV